MIEEKNTSLHPISILLCEVYRNLAEQGEVTFGLHDTQIQHIDSIVKTVHARYFGIDRFPKDEQKAAAYFCLLIKDHPVVDGNKRLAVLWLQIFCDTSGLSEQLQPPVGLDELAVSIEKSALPFDELIRAVQRIMFG